MQTFIVEIQGLNPTSKRNVLKIESDYLINNNNAHEIAERVLNYYKKTYITKFDFILDDEKSGDNVVVEGDEVVSVSYYTAAGVAVAAPVQGVNIVKTVYANGVVKTEKIFVK